MNHQYSCFKYFLLRTPSLPLSLNSIINPDYNNDLFKDALYNSSLELYNEMTKYTTGKIKKIKDCERLEKSLFKYWRRIHTRTTPYGLFSGVSIGEISDNATNIKLLTNGVRFIRLDMELLVNIIDIAEQSYKYELNYFPNDTIYKVGRYIRYYERRFLENKYFKHSISAIDLNPIIKKILLITKKGLGIHEITSEIRKQLIDFDPSEIEQFILELIDSKVLISEIVPVLTTNSPFEGLINILRERDCNNRIFSSLEEINNIIKRYNKGNYTNYVYTEIYKILDFLKVKYNNKNILQIDVLKESDTSNLNDKICEDLLSAINFLAKITPRQNAHENLEKFKEIFTQKYGEKEMDLLFVCDGDVGIGYPANYNGESYSNNLIKDFISPKQDSPEVNFNLDCKQALIYNKICESINNKQEIILTDDDIIYKDGGNFYNTLYCNFEITNLDGNLIKLNSAGGNSGANTLSRFSYLDSKIEEFVSEITKKEQYLEKLPIVEICHLPTPRIGNVLIRPNLRNYELTILTKSNLDKDNKIPISDLTVSIRNNKIIIKSKTLKTPIKLMHTNAFNNFLSTIPSFGLLCDLQYQENFNLNLSLSPNNYIKYCPRIRYKDIILSPATWNLNTSDTKDLVTSSYPDLIAWRKKYSIPQYVLFSEGDNELFIDFEDKTCINSFIDLARKSSFIKLKEFLYTKDKTPISDTNNDSYTNEFIISFYKNKK